jgi:hypothetical protein
MELEEVPWSVEIPQLNLVEMRAWSWAGYVVEVGPSSVAKLALAVGTASNRSTWLCGTSR